ncbi:MAG TPA: molybdopterin cofactor-binding domain-containing protein [Rhodopila sp.]|jgi:isoquinoline 1-oxidoreductase beta subunit|nr:molybdopterin cofactor-binding domain-containing protein [Rhodopila sp.]
MSNRTSLGRRSFLGSVAAIGGGLALGWRIPGDAAMAQKPAQDVGIWVVIAPDDTTTVRIARSEMGQGSFTGLAQLVADELDCDWKHVRAEYVPPEENWARNHAWGDMSTGGSRGIRASQDYVRKGGAAARAMLVQAAAQRWGVTADSCTAANSVITHAASGRRLRYGEVVAAAAKLPVPTDVTLKTPAQWTLIGKGVKRLDTVEKLSGRQVYAIDVKLPDMLCAAIAQCPVFGGTLQSFDADKVKGMAGVHSVVAVGDNAVAVVADKWFLAKTALAALPVVWNEGAGANLDSAQIDALLQTGLDAPEAAVGQQHGDVTAGLAGAAKTIEAVYHAPFLAHATMEPMNCTALIADGKVEIWVASQNGDASLTVAAKAAGVQPGDVKVHKLHLGGGFGRRGNQDYTRQAVLIAKQVPGRPVKLIWSREEDTQHDFYRPATQCKLSAGLDADGNVVALHARLSGPSILAYLMPERMEHGVDMVAFQGWTEQEFGYRSIPNLLLDHAVRTTTVPVGFWRGVNTNQNAIFMECFIDELAHAAGKDPLAFRRALLKDSPKHLAILDAVAEKADWGRKLPAGVFRGIAQNCGYGSYTAGVAEVSVSPQGALKIHRMVAATDPGHVVNSNQVTCQVEGSFVFGLGAVLFGAVTIDKGRAVQGNFDTYPVMRMADMPKVETVIAPSGGFWGGVGEPTIAVAGPAVLNAIFAATGKRIRSLPLGQQALRA